MRDLGRQIYTIYAADVDQDGQMEILLGTDAKTCWRLPCAGGKVVHSFENRLLSLYVIDIDVTGATRSFAGSKTNISIFSDEHGGEIWRHDLGFASS